MVQGQGKAGIVKRTERFIVPSMVLRQGSRVQRLEVSVSLFMSLGKDIMVAVIAPNVGARVLSVGLMASGQSTLGTSLVVGLS